VVLLINLVNLVYQVHVVMEMQEVEIQDQQRQIPLTQHQVVVEEQVELLKTLLFLQT
jgi:hypothetical protein